MLLPVADAILPSPGSPMRESAASFRTGGRCRRRRNRPPETLRHQGPRWVQGLWKAGPPYQGRTDGVRVVHAAPESLRFRDRGGSFLPATLPVGGLCLRSACVRIYPRRFCRPRCGCRPHDPSRRPASPARRAHGAVRRIRPAGAIPGRRYGRAHPMPRARRLVRREAHALLVRRVVGLRAGPEHDVGVRRLPRPTIRAAARGSGIR